MRVPETDPHINADLETVAQQLRRSTVQIRVRGGHGSGLIVEPGVVVTNAHVAGTSKAYVVLSDGQEIPSEVVARAGHRDLALLRVDGAGLPVAQFRDSRSLRPGDLVVAVGNPLGLAGAVTAGIVHAADLRGRHVVADVRLLPGNSGGPLADAQGSVVGVNAMVINGLAYAISSNVVKRFVAAPNARPHIGVVTRPVSIAVMGEQRLGMLVLETAARSAASRAGLLSGDVVIGIDGGLFAGPVDLPEAIDSAEVGARLRLDVVRGGRVCGIDVIVSDAARTQNKPAA